MSSQYSPTLDGSILTPVVRAALDRSAILGIEWRCEPFGDSYGARTGGVFHVWGSAIDAEQQTSLPWSVVLKISAAEESDADPAAWSFGPREARAYESGLLADLPAPRCFGVQEQGDGSLWLWLEHLYDRFGGRWPLERYGLAARHIGRLSGAYLVGRPLPTYPWMSRRWMRSLAALAEDAVVVAREGATWRRPQMPAYFTPTEGLLRRILADRERFLDCLDLLPQTLCHNDAWRNNLFACVDSAGVDRTLLIDWAAVGPGAIGQDIGPLVHMSVGLFAEEPENLRSLDEAVFSGYLRGLQDAGWDGDPRTARLGYIAASVIYAGGQTAMLTHVSLDEEWQKGWEEALGRPFDQILMRSAALAPYIAELSDEGRTLLAELRL